MHLCWWQLPFVRVVQCYRTGIERYCNVWFKFYASILLLPISCLVWFLSTAQGSLAIWQRHYATRRGGQQAPCQGYLMVFLQRFIQEPIVGEPLWKKLRLVKRALQRLVGRMHNVRPYISTSTFWRKEKPQELPNSQNSDIWLAEWLIGFKKCWPKLFGYLCNSNRAVHIDMKHFLRTAGDTMLYWGFH